MTGQHLQILFYNEAIISLFTTQGQGEPHSMQNYAVRVSFKLTTND